MREEKKPPRSGPRPCELAPRTLASPQNSGASLPTVPMVHCKRRPMNHARIAFRLMTPISAVRLCRIRLPVLAHDRPHAPPSMHTLRGPPPMQTHAVRAFPKHACALRVANATTNASLFLAAATSYVRAAHARQTAPLPLPAFSCHVRRLRVPHASAFHGVPARRTRAPCHDRPRPTQGPERSRLDSQCVRRFSLRNFLCK